MSVNIRIMQKGFFRRKKFIIDDLVKLSHLSFGVMDEKLSINSESDRGSYDLI